MLPSLEELRQMGEMDIMLADRAQLTELGTLEIDQEQPAEDRIKNYLEQVQNPFLVKAGEYILKFSYADCDKDMDDRLAEYVERMAKIHC